MSEINMVKTKVEIESIDIPSMAELSDDKYEAIIESNLMYVDHHEVLRDSLTGHPIATCTEQVDILINALQAFKSQMLPRVKNI